MQAAAVKQKARPVVFLSQSVSMLSAGLGSLAPGDGLSGPNSNWSEGTTQKRTSNHQDTGSTTLSLAGR